MNTYAESCEQVVERELEIWRAEQRYLATEHDMDVRQQRMRFREAMHEQFMSGVAPETLPMPRIGLWDVVLAVVGW